MIRKGLLEAVQTKRKSDMSTEVTAHVYQCERCGRKAVAEANAQMLCQNCVNEFLARNVGVMQPFEPEQKVVPLEGEHLSPDDRNK